MPENSPLVTSCRLLPSCMKGSSIILVRRANFKKASQGVFQMQITVIIFMRAFYVPDILLSQLDALYHLNLETTLQVRYYYYIQFSDEENEAQREVK